MNGIISESLSPMFVCYYMINCKHHSKSKCKEWPI